MNLSAVFQKTSRALLWMNLSHEPFAALYALLPFILRKDLGATLLQISILTSLRPLLPMFSLYWSMRHHLRTNLIGAWVIARIPFLFVPWIDNVWYIIFCCAVYELFNKSGIPALIEILKINLSKETRETTFTLCFVLSFLEGIGLGFLMAGLLDRYSSSWQLLSALTALLGLSSIFLQLKIPLPETPRSPTIETKFSQRILMPWKEAFHLLKKYPDFARFQIGFMMGGFGLMFITPSLSIFFVDHLRLSHADVIFGRSILMGTGIVISSYFWKRFFSRDHVPRLTQLILAGFSLYLLFLVFAQSTLLWFFASFLLYGIAQAGSHLMWNLSGTLFAGEEDSSPFSRLNILMLGLRGAVAPALGGLLCALFGPLPILIAGSLICFAGVFYMQLAQQSTAEPTRRPS